MEDSVDAEVNSTNNLNSPEIMEITPVLDDFLTPELMLENVINPYLNDLLKDEMTASDIDCFSKSFPDLSDVKYEKIHCTCCNKHIGSAPMSTPERYKHPLLKVVMCERCYVFYCSGDFEKDKDGSELYCRWCGEGGQVFCCSKCPYVFCKKCISRNLGRGTASIIENSDDWLCFNCNPCQISKLRAVCWAIMKYAEDMRERADESTEIAEELTVDYSPCCQPKTKRGKYNTGKESVKKVKLDKLGSLLKEAIMNTSNSKKQEKKSKFNWTIPTEPEDEVICTPDILPFEESPPSSPPPPPIVSIQDSPVASPKSPAPAKPKPTILARKSTTPRPPPPKPKIQAKVVPKIILPALTPPPVKTINNMKITPVMLNANTSSPITIKTIPQVNETVQNKVVSVVKKVNVPVTPGNMSQSNWFSNGVVKCAEATEYISSNVTKLATESGHKHSNEQDREQIYKTFQMYIEIAISKLRSVKQNMTFLFNNQKKLQLAPKVTPVTVPVPVPVPITPTVVVQKTRKRRKRFSDYVNSSSSGEWSPDDDDDEDFNASGKPKRKKITPKFQQVSSTPQTSVKNEVKIVTTPKTSKTNDNKVILDVIDLVDDNSNDALDDEKEVCKTFLPVTIIDDNSLSGNERDDEVEIDSDVSEILPDHLIDPSELENGLKQNDDEDKLNGENEEDSNDSDKKKGDESSAENDENSKDEEKNCSVDNQNSENDDNTKDSSLTAENKTENDDAEDKTENGDVGDKTENSNSIDSVEQDDKTESKNSDNEKSNEESVTKDEDESLDSKKEEPEDITPDAADDDSDDAVESKSPKESDIKDDGSDIKNGAKVIDDDSKSQDERLSINGDRDDSNGSSLELNENGSGNDENISNSKNINHESLSNDPMEDFEDILRTNTIPIVKEKSQVNFGDEFSKFVNSSNPTEEDENDEDENEEENEEENEDDDDLELDKELDMVSKMYEETEDDDALSLPPQNIVDFDISFKDKNVDNEMDEQVDYTKNKSEASTSECGSSKTALETELNELRKLAENCILTSDTMAGESKY